MSCNVSLVSGMATPVTLRYMGGEGNARSVHMPDMLPGSSRALEDQSKGFVWSHRNTLGRSIG
jgi:hypothetical protein